MNNNSEEQTPRKNIDDHNDKGNHGITYHLCKGEFSNTSKCALCDEKGQCINDSKKWW